MRAVCYTKRMANDEMLKLFKYMTERFDNVDKQLEQTATKTQVDDIANTMESFARQIKDNSDEQAARDLQFNRLVEWARKVSIKTGVPLPDL